MPPNTPPSKTPTRADIRLAQRARLHPFASGNNAAELYRNLSPVERSHLQFQVSYAQLTSAHSLEARLEELLNAMPAVSDTTKLDHLKDGIDRIANLLETVCVNTDAIIEIGAESIGVSRPGEPEEEEEGQEGPPEEEGQDGPPEDDTDEDSQQQDTLVDKEPE